jgi:hypothetical protein
VVVQIGRHAVDDRPHGRTGVGDVDGGEVGKQGVPVGFEHAVKDRTLVSEIVKERARPDTGRGVDILTVVLS